MSATETAATATLEQMSRRRLLVTLSAGHAVKHVLASGFFILLPEIKTAFGLSNAGVGAFTTVRQLVGGVANVPAGFTADTMSSRFAQLLIATMFFIGVFSIAFGLAPSPLFAVAAAGLYTASVTFWHPAAIGTLSRVYSDRRGFAIAWHGTGGSVGEALGPLIAGGLLSGVVLVAFTWRQVLLAGTVPALLMCLVLWLLLRGFSVPSNGVSVREYATAFAALLRERKLLVIFLITAGFSATQATILTFLPVYLREDLHLAPTWVGASVSLAQVVGIFAGPVIGPLSDRFGRKAVVVPSLAVLSGAALALYLVPPGPLFILSLVVLGAFLFSLMSIMVAAAGDVVPPGMHSTTVSLVFGTSVIFAASAPYLTGRVADAYSVHAAFLVASGIAGSAALFALVTRWERKRE